MFLEIFLIVDSGLDIFDTIKRPQILYKNFVHQVVADIKKN